MHIRNESPADYRAVEELTRKAFWNLHSPGCDEHYLVHVMRNHADFVPELDYVIERGGAVIANIMYTKAKLIGKNGGEKPVLTFGPLSVLPEHQRNGYGKALMAHSFERAARLGYDAVVIFGNPENYVSSGFKSCRKYNICIGDYIFPTALLVKELREGAVPEDEWTFRESDVYELDRHAAEAFDRTFEPLEKAYRQSQELFYIYSRSRVVG